MSKFLVDIPYLEIQDINLEDASIKPHVNQGKPILLMIQGNFCHFCTDAKPAVQELAKMMPNVCVATIQIDGEQAEQQAATVMKKVNSSSGVPAYLIFNSNGKFVKMHEGGRDLDSLRSSLQ